MSVIVPKNSTEGMTEAWKRERASKMKYYQAAPVIGNEFGQKLYDAVIKVIPSLIQASVCGVVVSLVTYKQDADKARHLLANSFKTTVKQKTCPYTEYVTTYLINS